jgi:hypothetical protein
MPEPNDLTALALLAVVLVMGERWARRLVDAIESHLDKQSATLAEIKKVLSAIQESLSDSSHSNDKNNLND